MRYKKYGVYQGWKAFLPLCNYSRNLSPASKAHSPLAIIFGQKTPFFRPMYTIYYRSNNLVQQIIYSIIPCRNFWTWIISMTVSRRKQNNNAVGVFLKIIYTMFVVQVVVSKYNTPRYSKILQMPRASKCKKICRKKIVCNIHLSNGIASYKIFHQCPSSFRPRSLHYIPPKNFQSEYQKNVSSRERLQVVEVFL